MANIRLSEFEVITTLGLGGFGRVELVRNTRDFKTHALKIMKKQLIYLFFFLAVIANSTASYKFQSEMRSKKNK